jgi:hypothetical protein
LTPVLKEVLLWVKCYQTASYATEKSLMKGRANWFGKLYCCVVLRNCHSHPSRQQPPPWSGSSQPISKKVTTCWKLKWWLAFFSNEVFLIKIFTLFFRHNAIADLIDYIIVQTTFICTGKPKNLWLALLRWSGTEPAISPRYACDMFDGR